MGILSAVSLGMALLKVFGLIEVGWLVVVAPALVEWLIYIVFVLMIGKEIRR